ncbi:hypothetical protein LX36DRAFT_732770, partial [Colletotrichum falcatum]
YLGFTVKVASFSVVSLRLEKVLSVRLIVLLVYIPISAKFALFFPDISKQGSKVNISI